MAYYFHRPRGRLSQGSRLVSSASRADLLAAAVAHYAEEAEEAVEWYEATRTLVRQNWQKALQQAGMPEPETSKYAQTLGMDLPA